MAQKRASRTGAFTCLGVSVIARESAPHAAPVLSTAKGVRGCCPRQAETEGPHKQLRPSIRARRKLRESSTVDGAQVGRPRWVCS